MAFPLRQKQFDLRRSPSGDRASSYCPLSTRLTSVSSTSSSTSCPVCRRRWGLVSPSGCQRHRWPSRCLRCCCLRCHRQPSSRCCCHWLRRRFQAHRDVRSILHRRYDLRKTSATNQMNIETEIVDVTRLKPTLLTEAMKRGTTQDHIFWSDTKHNKSNSRGTT